MVHGNVSVVQERMKPPRRSVVITASPFKVNKMVLRWEERDVMHHKAAAGQHNHSFHQSEGDQNQDPASNVQEHMGTLSSRQNGQMTVDRGSRPKGERLDRAWSL